jgi:hypothetical protein
MQGRVTEYSSLGIRAFSYGDLKNSKKKCYRKSKTLVFIPPLGQDFSTLAVLLFGPDNPHTEGFLCIMEGVLCVMEGDL